MCYVRIHLTLHHALIFESSLPDAALVSFHQWYVSHRLRNTVNTVCLQRTIRSRHLTVKLQSKSLTGKLI